MQQKELKWGILKEGKRQRYSSPEVVPSVGNESHRRVLGFFLDFLVRFVAQLTAALQRSHLINSVGEMKENLLFLPIRRRQRRRRQYKTKG